MLVTKQIEIDMGHRVPNHKSKCRNLHGHRYKIEVGVDDKKNLNAGASDEGMVIDFGDLKEIMMSEIDAQFDHKCVLYEKDELKHALILEQPPVGIVLVQFIPTAENLAQYWYILLKNKLQERDIKIKHVTVWETPSSTATYKE